METTRIPYPRDIATLLHIGIVYWLAIYPRARREIGNWKRRAARIPSETLRIDALDKLTREHLNPEAAALFAVLAPSGHRRTLIRLIVAYQAAYDYIDAVNEHPGRTSLMNGLQLHRALTDAVSPHSSTTNYYLYQPQTSDDGGYLADLVGCCQSAIAQLPSLAPIQPVLLKAARRCGEAQSHNHAVLSEGDTQLVNWTVKQNQPSYLWWELAAGGISCLALHALFAAAAAQSTIEEAERIDAAYFPSICALSALLDSLIDQPEDTQTTNHSFTSHYETQTQAAQRFGAITSEARKKANELNGHRRHAVILAGIASFYLSAPEARSRFARPIAGSTLGALGAITLPLLAIIRAMRKSIPPVDLSHDHRRIP